MSKRKMRGKTRRKRGTLGAKGKKGGITLMEKDRKSAKEQHLSNTWEDHSALYPQREDTRFVKKKKKKRTAATHGSNAGSGGV